ncbi:GNAT family N-acetyltransferase [Candidatus Micrarchaeota archaeon]|nr:GNAT family N-acetyltransferase [Candidatus Micrarchaeota archaeon]
MDTNKLIFERLDKKHFELLKSFQCCQKDLGDFLVDDAIPNQKKGISVTYMFFSKEKKFVGYVSILTDNLNLNADLKGYFKQKEDIHYKSLPALKIGRLAVDDRYARQGVGTEMVYFSIYLAEQIYGNYCGCRFITLDAKRDSKNDTTHFYKKLGFKVYKERQKGSVPMYLDLWLRSDIKKSKKN